MLLPLISGLALLTLGVQGQLTTTELRCTTNRARFQVHDVKSYTATSYVTYPPRVINSYTRAIVTETPPARTSTFTNVATKVATVTRRVKLATVSTTITSSTTSTRITTATTTTTTTIKTVSKDISTYTVPIPAGFSNIADTLKYVPEPPPLAPALHQENPEIIRKQVGAFADNRGFPSAVKCTKLVKVQNIRTTTIKLQTTTTLRPRLVYVTRTLTTTSTSVSIIANMKTTRKFFTTLTRYTWVTSTSTSIKSTTTTETEKVVETEYAACGTNNLLTSFPDGRQWGPFDDDPSLPVIRDSGVLTDYKTPESCCGACQARNDICVGSLFYFEVSGHMECLHFYRQDNTCPSQKSALMKLSGAVGSPGAFTMFMSNGPCGLFYEPAQEGSAQGK